MTGPTFKNLVDKYIAFESSKGRQVDYGNVAYRCGLEDAQTLLAKFDLGDLGTEFSDKINSLMGAAFSTIN